MNKLNQIVTSNDVRPARLDGTCFYCGAALGEEHRKGCVCRRRTVVVDITFRLVREVPEDWDVEQIEFSLNESSSCASNFIGELTDADSDEHCLCSRTTGKFIRDATKEDEEAYLISNVFKTQPTDSAPAASSSQDSCSESDQA